MRNGSEYIAGLQDAREVWLNGERVEDVTTHPSMRESVATIGRLYDLQSAPEHLDTLSYDDHDGGRTPMSFLPPAGVEDVARRGLAFRTCAAATGGLMGRSPDYLNSALTAWAAASDFFGASDPRYGQNVLDYYEHCKTHDLALTHAITDPQIDRSRQPHEQDDPYAVLGIVRETSEGVIVRGAKMLATLAPYSDELLIYSFMPLGEGDAAYALAFAVPVATPGLRVLCRPAFAATDERHDQPLAAMLDEMDAMVIFDDVLVPWHRLFVKGDVAASNNLRTGTDMPAFLAHQATSRGLAKAEFTFGVATQITETIGTQSFPAVQEKLGELVSIVEMMRCCIRAAEVDARLGAHGVYIPSLDALNVAMTTFPRAYPRMIELLQLLGSSGLIMTPSAEDMTGERSADTAKYFRGATVEADERVRLFKVASDLAISSFGGRQVLYERFYAGDLSRLLANNFKRYDKEPARRSVTRVMETLETSTAARG
jgi:4-hydroxyphenylacetate 3-monooxygenase oxygenase component